MTPKGRRESHAKGAPPHDHIVSPVRRQADRHRSPDPRRQGRLRPQRHHPRLFCRQTVLPHLGEDPQAYQRLLDTLHEQLRPRNLMETQYLELWADASWKLRRLSRLEAQAWEDDASTKTPACASWSASSRLQNGLRRQLDKAGRMLSQDVPRLFDQRTREDIIAKLRLTETLCDESPFREKDVHRPSRPTSSGPPRPDDLTASLDNAPADPDTKNLSKRTRRVHGDGLCPAPLSRCSRASSPSPLQGEGRSPPCGERGRAPARGGREFLSRPP